jgi:hypothetical protein
MSLAIEVGQLAYSLKLESEGADWLRKYFEEVNRLLTANGLPPHREPETLPPIRNRAGLLSFPYSYLHYLRRALAYARQAPDEFHPVPEGEKPTADAWLDEEQFSYMDSHIICHSDCEGFYVPIDFPKPLYDDGDYGVVGRILGSSIRGLAELGQVAPLLGISLQDGVLSDREAAVIAQEMDVSQPYWIERQVWLTFFEALRNSIEFGTAVVFT